MRPVQIKSHAGVSYFFGAYNVQEDVLWMQSRNKDNAKLVKVQNSTPTL